MNGRRAMLREKNGTTMVEVIVAFLILIIVLEIFSQAAVLAGRIVLRSGMNLKENRNLAGSYYLEGQEDPEAGKAGRTDPMIETVTLYFEGENGASFQIPAKVRTFTGEAGNLYDAVSIHRKEERPETSDHLEARDHWKKNDRLGEGDHSGQDHWWEEERQGT